MKQKRNTKNKKTSLSAKSSSAGKKGVIKKGNSMCLSKDSKQDLEQLNNYKAFFRHLLSGDFDDELVDETD